MRFSAHFHTGALAFALALTATSSKAHDGDLDPTFGAGGFSHTGLTDTQEQAMAVRPDGRIVVCGSYADEESLAEEFFVAQYLPDGSLDSTFGNHGITYVDASSVEDTCTGLVIQPDGRIVAAGYSEMPQFPGGATDFPVVARLEPNGAMDPAFGEDGLITYVQTGDVTGVAVQADGKIVLAGSAKENGGVGTDYAVVRLLTNGSPDPDFGTNGRITIGFEGTGTYDFAAAVVIDREQRIVIAGSADRYLDGRLGVVRLLQDGSFDGSFANNGMAVIGDDSYLLHGAALKLAHDGKILVAGDRTASPRIDMMVARLLDDGSLDTSFGMQGVATVASATTAWRSIAHGLDEQSNGKIVIAGWAGDPDNNDFLAVARIDSDGSTDTAFGNAGFSAFALPESPGEYHSASAMALSAGRILVAGTSGYMNYNDLIARLQNDLIFADAF